MNALQIDRSARRVVAALTSVALVLLPLADLPAHAGLATSIGLAQPRPQVVIAIGNSQSMDGDLSGAIMTGSGSLGSALSSLNNSSSPVNYTVPAGFTSPVTGAQSGSAPYTATNSSGALADNSASRLNVAKAGIQAVLQQYLSSIDFGLATYSTTGTSLYTTWVYYMSPPGGFTFANSLPTNGFTSYSQYQAFATANPSASPTPTRWVSNPCYNYSSASSTVKSNCTSMAGVFGSSTLSGNRYMKIGASSDDPDINDVLYASGQPGVFVNYGGAYAAYNYSTNLGPINPPSQTPYTYFNLSNYNNGVVSVGYNNSQPSASKITGPTNAGYVPYSDQVIYAQRGFGYYVQSLNATTAKTTVAVTNLGNNPSSTSVNSALATFQSALNPETNSTSSAEIKALAYQSPTAGLVTGAGNILQNLPNPSCAGQYVILVTDGLPTMDKNGKAWPPLGSASGQGYGVNAAFYGVAGQNAYGINDDSGNVPSGQVQGALDASKTNDQALIDTINAIKTLNTKGIKTYVIGLGAGVDSTKNPAAYYALNAMAIAGGTGQQYPANDIQTFNNAIASIAAQIFQNIAVSAPIAPASVKGGSLVYTATSNNQSGSIAGHLQAYKTVTTAQSTVTAPIGTASGPAQWDAGSPTLMPVSERQKRLYSTAAPTSSSAPPGSGPVRNFAAMGTSNSPYYDASAFGLSSPTTCVPNVATIVAYTLDPSFNTPGDSAASQYGSLGFPTGVSGCSYLMGRQLNWMLGNLSPNDQTSYLAAPGTAALTGLGGYVQFAANNKGRENLVLLTSNDGFLYAVDSQTGSLVWGWMPRPFLSYLQRNQQGSGSPANATLITNLTLFDGGFSLTDAVNTSNNPSASNWASYVVGTAQGGGYHYALQLSSNASATVTAAPTPQAVTWAISTPTNIAPANAAPLALQAPLIITINGMQYAVFVVNVKNSSGAVSSTLYEINVATGQPAYGTALSAALPFSAYSAMSYDPGSGTLWIGDANGGVWSLNLSGSASTDVTSALQIGTAYTPSGQSAALNYVGYTEVGGLPYAWAASNTTVTLFSLSGGTSQIVWAANGTSGYQYQNGTLQGVAGSVVQPLQSGGVISAAPVVANGLLVVPVYVPPGGNSCGYGQGYYDLYDLTSGARPKINVTYKGNVVSTGQIGLGVGIPLSPSLFVTSSGVGFYPYTTASAGTGSSGNSGAGSGGIWPVAISGSVMNKPIAWRQY